MFPSREGQPVPAASLMSLVDDRPTAISTAELFPQGRTVVVFALPGAFTPTCSSSHVPRYEELYEDFLAAGVDEILCVSVNDAFVMEAWALDQGVEHVRFLADGNGDFTREMGLLVDKHDLGFGERSWRYSMLVRDGVVVKQFIEPDVPGDPYKVSDADTMLDYLVPNRERHPEILLLVKQGCQYCHRARAALEAAKLPFTEVWATPSMLRAVSETPTTPRVFVGGKLIGGSDELVAWLETR